MIDARTQSKKFFFFYLFLLSQEPENGVEEGGGGYIGGEARERGKIEYFFYLYNICLLIDFFVFLVCLKHIICGVGMGGGFKRTKSIDSFLHYIHGQEGTIKKTLAPPKKLGHQ